MPFRRRRITRRRPRRRRLRRFRRRRRRRMVALDPERKFLDIAFSITVDNVGVTSHMNPVGQGVNQNQRIGLQHLNVSFQMSWQVIINPTPVPTNYKMVVLWDTQADGALAQPSEFWVGTSGANAALGMRELNNALRFKTIWSKKLTVDAEHPIRRGEMMRRFRVKTRWLTDGLNIANVASMPLIFLAVSDQVGTSAPLLSVFTRLRFVG